MSKRFRLFTWINIVFVFLVILAGGIVRMTHSGMGCPDWPTCFGMWIPPINESQLPPDFEKYLSLQDIDHSFNVYHTWVEYINRLLGAVLGVLILIHFIWSFLRYRETNKVLVGMSFLWLVAVAFTGWLGKVVVNENLAVSKISIHMVSAVILVFIPMVILIFIKRKAERSINGFLKWFSLFFFIICLVQMLKGIGVRQEVDSIAKAMSYESRELWIGKLSGIFNLHRSSSWVVLIGALVIVVKKDAQYMLTLRYCILANVLVLFGLGIAFSYGGFPAWAQPLHLLFGVMLVTMSFYYMCTLFCWSRDVD